MSLIFSIIFFFTYTLFGTDFDELSLVATNNGQRKISFDCQSMKIGCLDLTDESDYFVENIKEVLQKTGQFKLVSVKKASDKFFARDYYYSLEKHDALMMLVFFKSGEHWGWKLYDVMGKNFIDGKQYSIKYPKTDFIHIVCRDIWKAMLGEPTPFDLLLAYVKKNEGSKGSAIYASYPFLTQEDRKILESTNIIFDLTALEHNRGKLVYAEPTHHGLKLTLLSTGGSVKPLVDIGETVSCFVSTPYQNIAFYVRSGVIMKYYFCEKEKKVKHVPFVKMPNIICSQPITLDKERLIFICKNKIYECRYAKNGVTLSKAEAIKQLFSSQDYISSISYSAEISTIVYSKRIGKHMQLVAYNVDSQEESVLTFDSYHKFDPCISPCGNYIAYVALDKKLGKKSIEILNIYTKKKVCVTGWLIDCAYPCWIHM